MTDSQRYTLRTWVTRIGIYFLLSFFALLMLFPFIYMMSTSFKTSNDVFHYPPRVLPYSPVTTEYEGETRPLYRFEVDGEPRELVLTGEKERFGLFTTPELLDVDTPRNSPVFADVRLADTVETAQEYTFQTTAGEADDLPVYAVPVDGEMMELLLISTPNKDVFANPDNPEVVVYGFERTAEAVEEVEFQVENYDTVLGLNLDRALVNTTIVTLGVTIGQLVTSIFGGYAFSRIKFKGRDALFLAYLGSIMVPFVVLIIPIYRLMVVIGWEGRLVSLIVPWIFTAYGTFLMRQFFITIPKEIEEAALLDGCSRFRILWTIFVPLSTPAIATLGIFSFLYAWNSFLWPLLIIGEGNERNHVLTLSLIRLSNIAADQPNLVLTGAAVAIIPPIIVFVLAQKYFIEGIATSGLKG
ncbi:MAG: carbohydrate ABC transporter permease [Anaerolineae bacterium]|nr:carbohydrate ABC transporter permease [Anaerolineae bacterium]